MLLSKPIKALLVPTLFGLSIGTGCAHQQQPEPSQAQVQQQKVVAKLKSRLEEVERTNGRLNVRIEELEDQIFLLQDMTESNRIALRRRGYMRRGGYITGKAQAQAPQPAPETYYGSESPYGSQQQPQARRAKKRRKVTRIPLSRQQSGASRAPEQQQRQPAQPAAEPQAPAQAEGDAAEVVITEDEYREFVGEKPARSKSRSRSSSKSSRKAQPPVTDEKLTTTDGDSKSAKADKEQAAPAAKNVDNPLDLYKTALADYRGGNYADALEGFRGFLQAGPNANYLDNALYWIGECHYGLGSYTKATAYFQRVLSEQPDGNKVPDAMLKMSLAFERLGKANQSRALLEKLTNRYPTTNAGRLGAQKLSELGN